MRCHSFETLFFCILLCLSKASCFTSRPSTSNISHQKSLSTGSLSMVKGCAATPYKKKKVAVMGAGGYLGATISGFLQRASSIYGTGISDTSSSPRAITATGVGSESLNKILGRSFKLAFAGENFIRLTNMQDLEHIAARIDGYDAVVLATIYQLEKRPVTANTYETSPNDKTLELYMDNRNLVDATISDDDLDVHLTIFRNSINACKSVGIQHIVVMETPATKDRKPFAEILDEGGLSFTYIHASGNLENTKLYTFEEGVQADLNIQGFTFPSEYATRNGYTSGDWSESIPHETKSSNGKIPREDLAAVAVQSLMSLDWRKSRYLDVSSNGAIVNENSSPVGTYVPTKILKSDKDWLLSSDIIADKLNAME